MGCGGYRSRDYWSCYDRLGRGCSLLCEKSSSSLRDTLVRLWGRFVECLSELGFCLLDGLKLFLFLFLFLGVFLSFLFLFYPILLFFFLVLFFLQLSLECGISDSFFNKFVFVLHHRSDRAKALKVITRLLLLNLNLCFLFLFT